MAAKNFEYLVKTLPSTLADETLTENLNLQAQERTGRRGDWDVFSVILVAHGHEYRVFMKREIQL